MAKKKSSNKAQSKNLERILDTAQKLDDYFRTTQDKTVILFADLANSTQYKQQRPFVMGLNKTRLHNNIATDIIVKNKGRIVKYIGDAVLARFDIGKNEHRTFVAINTAIQIQEAFEEFNVQIHDSLERIESKIGIACGVVADFYGEDTQGAIVDLAARIQSTAKACQILVHKPLIDTCNLNKVYSVKGKVKRWTGADYLSQPVKLSFKGIAEPQEIVEILWSGKPLGIKEEDKYDEYWENYRYDATVLPLSDEFPEELKNRYFNIIFDLRYQTVLTKTKFHFVCVNAIDDLSKAMKDHSLFSRYMLPKSSFIQDRLDSIFKVDFFRIDSNSLHELEFGNATDNYYFGRTFIGEQLELLLGKKVTVHYRINSIIAKRGHFFAMLTEYPVKNLSMNLDMAGVPIRSVRPVDYFAVRKEPKFTYTPSYYGAKKIEVFFEDWVYPRGGVVFIWDLENYDSVLPPF